MGSRAFSHDSIFIPDGRTESEQAIQAMSQENVLGKVKILQVRNCKWEKYLKCVGKWSPEDIKCAWTWVAFLILLGQFLNHVKFSGQKPLQVIQMTCRSSRFWSWKVQQWGCKHICRNVCACGTHLNWTHGFGVSWSVCLSATNVVMREKKMKAMLRAGNGMQSETSLQSQFNYMFICITFFPSFFSLHFQ